MRPELRILRHPVVPRQAAVAHRRVDPRRGGPARRGPDGSSARWCSSPRTSRRSPSTGRPAGPSPRLDGPAVGAAGDRSSSWWPRWPNGSAGPAALPLPVDARRRAGRGHPRHRRALLRPLAAARVAAAAQAHAPVGRRRPVPRSDRARSGPSEPTAAFRSSFIIGYPGETEADHDRLLEWIDEAQLDWVGFFPFSSEAGTYAAELDGQVPDGAGRRAAARVLRAPGRHHRQSAGRAHRDHGRGAGGGTGRGPHLPRGPGDRRDRDPARRPRGGIVRRRGGDRGRRPRPRSPSRSPVAGRPRRTVDPVPVGVRSRSDEQRCPRRRAHRRRTHRWPAPPPSAPRPC